MFNFTPLGLFYLKKIKFKKSIFLLEPDIFLRLKFLFLIQNLMSVKAMVRIGVKKARIDLLQETLNLLLLSIIFPPQGK